MLVVGVVAGLVTALLGAVALMFAVGWIASAGTYIAWVWLRVGHLDSASTKAHATREDPSRGAAELLLVLASLASLGVVALVLIDDSSTSGVSSGLIALLAILSVALSWALVHTLFMLRYASLYYSGVQGGVDFHQQEDPDYGDFAYLSFTLGMTYQVSDTDLSDRRFRVMALRHSLLSFVFGAVILATVINLIAGLGA